MSRSWYARAHWRQRSPKRKRGTGDSPRLRNGLISIIQRTYFDCMRGRARHHGLLLPILLGGVLCLSGLGRADQVGDDFFESRIRPVLVERCHECHAGDSPEAELLLISRETLLRGGQSGPAAVEHDPDASLLMQVLGYEGEVCMPPDSKLDGQQVADFRSWIEAGIPWPSTASHTAAPAAEKIVTEADRQHWSFRPIQDPPLPVVRDTKWVQTSPDAWILARLEAAGIEPAPPADRRTLLRRAYLDLMGLPPTAAEYRAFESDPAPEAWEHVLDRLLGSPRYGERWARHWLDVARYADTKDGVLMYGDARIRPYAYTYRDYVIRALNEDVPFDQFVREQLAADLIEPPVAPWRLAAMGFLTLGRSYDNNIHDVIDDQIDTTTRGFLGLTVSCARCHDHKYDPIPTADYYSLYGVFASSEAPLFPPQIAEPQDSPEAQAFEKEYGAKRQALEALIDQQFALLTETARQRIGDYLVHVATTPPDPMETAIFVRSLSPEDLRPQMVARWRRLLARRGQPDDPVFAPWYEVMQVFQVRDTKEAEETIRARVALALDRFAARPAGTGPGAINPLVLQALTRAPLTQPRDVAQAYGALFRQINKESKRPTPEGGAAATEDVHVPARQQLLRLISGHESPLYFPRKHTQYYTSRKESDQLGAMITELDRLAANSPAATPRAMVLQEATQLCDPCIFARGNPAQGGRSVPRQFPAIASTARREPFPHGSGRMDLAQAITSADNPLTARVIVNRVWMYHFGEPLVATPSDFGLRSEPPTHPELLDHLASRLVQGGWSLKRLHRLIMMSSAYQMASRVDASSSVSPQAVDPENHLLWRMNRQRLDFEAMRDSLLAVSGQLRHRLGGPASDFTIQADNPRRTIYGLVDRQGLPGIFRVFDFAAPDQSVERRSRTMTPQQALFATNSPFVMAQAKAVAALPDVANPLLPDARVIAMFQAVLGREPQRTELAQCLAFAEMEGDPDSQLSRWEQLAQILLITNEMMYVD